MEAVLAIVQIAGIIGSGVLAVLGAVWLIGKFFGRANAEIPEIKKQLQEIKDNCDAKCGVNSEQNVDIALLKQSVTNLEKGYDDLKNSMEKGFEKLEGLILGNRALRSPD